MTYPPCINYVHKVRAHRHKMGGTSSHVQKNFILKWEAHLQKFYAHPPILCTKFIQGDTRTVKFYLRMNENLHPWVRVDQAGRPLPPKTFSILVGLTD